MLKVNEIFNSISGEYSIYGQGVTTTFLRLSGCNIQCPYCDTEHTEFTEWNSSILIKALQKEYEKTGHLCITGGEPLLQAEIVGTICNTFKNVWIETNGTLDFVPFIGYFPLVVDYKLWFYKGDVPERYTYLCDKDCIKFVIGSKEEVDEVINIHKKLKNKTMAKFAYSVIHTGRTKDRITKYIVDQLIENKLHGVLNVQIHKYLNFK